MTILSNEPMWSFENLRSINAQDRFTHFDYARVLRQSGKIDQKMLLEWLQAYAPPLVEHGGRIYLSEQFSLRDFDETRLRAASDSDAQLFMNLVNVTDLLGQESSARVPAVAAQLADNLNRQISSQFPTHQDRAMTLVDDGEHYISIVQGGR